MSLQSDHKALLFLGAIAVLGGGVRLARAVMPGEATAQPALEHQMQAADSAKRAAGARKKSPARRRGRAAATQTPSAPASPGTAPPTSAARGWVNGRLDLDVASAAQIDSLPGVGPALARKITADRMARGPFMNLSGLRRVKGMSLKTVQRLDTLVTFSGTIAQPSPADTIIPRKKRGRM